MNRVGQSHRRCSDRLAQAFAQRPCFSGGCIGQQHGELVATQSRYKIARAQCAAQSACDFDQSLIARCVVELVVHALEVIDINHRDTYRLQK